MKLKEIIDRKGITYAAIARHLGVSSSYVSQMLNGKRNIPLHTLISILEFTEISIDEIEDDFEKYGAIFNVLRKD